MLDLDMNQQFAIHATAIAIKEFDREELEEAFVEMLYNKAVTSDFYKYYERTWHRC